MLTLDFQSGTLALGNCPVLPDALTPWFKSDERSNSFRARACDYAEIVMTLLREKIPFADNARNYQLLPLALKEKLIPRKHQTQALEAWQNNQCRGVTALPTGAGKTILAVMAIAHIQRSTLILVPTIDLLSQWCSTLERFFDIPIGMLGGGEHNIREITVSTYDSALLNIEFIGNKFAFLIADECHHLPSPENRLCAAMSIAPFRLGLSATPELNDEYTLVMRDLLGETVCNISITELSGTVLSPYTTKKIFLELSGEEKLLYTQHRNTYTGFLRRYSINPSSPGGWAEFLIASSRYPGGKEALHSFMTQRYIARAGKAKLQAVADLLVKHAGERIIIFTADNDAAYSIGRTFTLPVLTHHTKAAERKNFLDKFRSGCYPVLVTSKVLNEGVDVPDAAVGIIVSGSGSVREHVQRLGRILRPSPGKMQAVLYELISANTSEESISDRRRAHHAYRRKNSC